MDVTPVTHRVRRSRIALGKCNSKNVQSYPNATLASSERTGSPETSPLFVSTPTTSSHTPSSGSGANMGRPEKLTRSALRREFLFEEDEDDFIMPCTQLQNPGENGQVFWNYNASPATARAKAILEEKMRQTVDDKNSENNKNDQRSEPSPMQTLPFFHTRRKTTFRVNEGVSEKEIERRKEADAMLESMKNTFQTEIQKHQTQIKFEVCGEMNNTKISSSGSSTDPTSHMQCSSNGSTTSSGSSTDRISESHLQCSSNGSTQNDGSGDINGASVHVSNYGPPKLLDSSKYEKTILSDSPVESHKSLDIDGLASDDDSFFIKCSQALDKGHSESAVPSFTEPLSIELNINKKNGNESKLASYNTQQTLNVKHTVPDSKNINARKSNHSNHDKVHNYRTNLPPKTKQQKVETKEIRTPFDCDDDFDIMLSQMEIPEIPRAPVIEDQPVQENMGFKIKHLATSNKNDLLRHEKCLRPSNSNCSNVKVKEDHVQISYPTMSANISEGKFPALKDKCLENISKTLKTVPSAVSDIGTKRFKSGQEVSTSNEQTLIGSENSKKLKSFGRRSYSTPDTTSSNNQLPGGRDISVKLSEQRNIESKPKCTREEIERKRLEAIERAKKREIERKRQEAIKKRQINSQKNSNQIR